MEDLYSAVFKRPFRPIGARGEQRDSVLIIGHYVMQFGAERAPRQLKDSAEEPPDHLGRALIVAGQRTAARRMQHLLSRARLDEQVMLDTAADWVVGHLAGGQGENDVVLIVDETADAKSSADCAGAARQYSGTLGGIAMCQVAVTLTCEGPAGHAADRPGPVPPRGLGRRRGAP
jgi:SRSO17 transposase